MYEKSLDIFLKEPSVKKEKNLVIFEITLSNLLSEGEIDEIDFMEKLYHVYKAIKKVSLNPLLNKKNTAMKTSHIPITTVQSAALKKGIQYTVS